jgi:serine protease
MSNMAPRLRALAGLALALVFTTGAWASGAGTPDFKRYMIEFHVYGPHALQTIEARGGRVALELPNYRVAAAYLPESAVQALARHPNVREIAEDVKRFPMAETVPYGIPMVQADQVSDANAGNRKVCIIDSGYWPGHEDLSDSTHVTFGPNRGSGSPDTDGCGHGSHVAGTIAALKNDVGVIGVLPNDKVNLHIIKVFNDSCGWTYSSGLIQALEDCRTAEAHVVNMSLGGGKAIGPWEERAFNDAYAAGVLSVASAGNSGNNQKSYPASYDSVISVAAIDANKVVADFSQKNDQVELSAPGVAVLSTVPWIEDNSLTVGSSTYDGNYIDGAARTAGVSGDLVDGGLCTSGGSWAGAIVLCARGQISFADKVANVQASGGHAAVIYNNEPGGFFGTLQGTSTIPAISLSQEHGQFLIANKIGVAGTVVSQVEELASGYEEWNGTSMAAPHVSGVAALVWSHNQSWTNAEIRQALRATAEDLGPAGRDNAYGHGLVQAKAALTYLTGGEPDPGPDPGPGPDPETGTMSVANITGTVRARGPWRSAEVTVTIHDGNGSAVANATVYGTFYDEYGDVWGSVVTGTTGSDGTVILESPRVRQNSLSFGFCVTDVDHASLDYDSTLNTKTCIEN